MNHSLNRAKQLEQLRYRKQSEYLKTLTRDSKPRLWDKGAKWNGEKQTQWDKLGRLDMTGMSLVKSVARETCSWLAHIVAGIVTGTVVTLIVVGLFASMNQIMTGMPVF